MVWTVAAVGLVLRQRSGLAVLLLIELLALYGWVEEPGDWLLFCVQVVLVLLLLSPPMDRYAPLPPSPPERESRMSVVLIGGSVIGALLLWAAVEAISGDAAAIPLLTIACVFLILVWRVESARERTDASGHSRTLAQATDRD